MAILNSMLTLSIPKIELGVWMPLLGGGIGFSVTPGVTLKEFLCHRLAIQPNYLKQRIQTILVNGQAIDEVDRVQINDGDVIALSAAMPGLAGTTLRKGSHLAAMRSGITHHCDAVQTESCRMGVVTLKLFNLVAREIGPTILSGHILVKEEDLRYLKTRYPSLSFLKIDATTEEWIEVQLLPQANA